MGALRRHLRLRLLPCAQAAPKVMAASAERMSASTRKPPSSPSGAYAAWFGWLLCESSILRLSGVQRMRQAGNSAIMAVAGALVPVVWLKDFMRSRRRRGAGIAQLPGFCVRRRRSAIRRLRLYRCAADRACRTRSVAVSARGRRLAPRRRRNPHVHRALAALYSKQQYDQRQLDCVHPAVQTVPHAVHGRCRRSGGTTVFERRSRFTRRRAQSRPPRIGLQFFGGLHRGCAPALCNHLGRPPQSVRASCAVHGRNAGPLRRAHLSHGRERRCGHYHRRTNHRSVFAVLKD